MDPPIYFIPLTSTCDGSTVRSYNGIKARAFMDGILYTMSGLRKLFIRRDDENKVAFIGSLFPMPTTVIDD